MLRRHILLKYTDVFQTSPDPAAYYAQVRRYAGDIPLNIFSTVNGYFATEEGGLRAQPSLEHELVSGIVQDMLARFRQRFSTSQDSLIFTRPSGLLNLKALISVPRDNDEYVAANIGMLALHANDYTDISLPNADPEVFAVQNLPIWELHNPRDVADLLARYYFITQEMYVHDKRIVELFVSEFERAPADVLIDGLVFEDYFALLFGLYTAASFGGRDRKTSILNLEEHLELLGLSTEQAGEFITARVATEDGLMKQFERLDTAESFAEHVRQSSWALDFRAFREHPLLRLSDGRVIVPDLQFLIENASVGMFWNVFRRMTDRGRDRLLAYWGTVFERYIRRQMEAHPPIAGTVTFNVDPQDLEVDALLSQSDDVFVFEVKAGMLPQDAKCSRDVAMVRKAIERKFVTNLKGNPKGVTQLARRCMSLAEKRAGQRVYPILVVDEPALQTPGINTCLARRLRTIVDNHATIAPLAVITGDELELMLPYLSAGDLTWKELIDARVDRGEVSANPVSTTFMEFAEARKFHARSNAILGPARNELAELVHRKYEHLK